METDPITGKPVLQKQEGERDDLLRKAALANLPNTEAGRLITGMIEERLFKKIQELLEADPECRAYVSMLVKMGHAVNIAQQAATKLLVRYGMKGE